jgi:IS5 family transposase
MPAKKQKDLGSLREHLSVMAGRVRQMVQQTKVRIFDGVTQLPGKIVSLFEPHTEIIRKGKASKPTEFGKLVKIQEAENQIITDYAVYAERPSDSELLVGAVETHEQRLGCTPRLIAADAGFYSAKNEAIAHDKGVKRVCIPNRSTKSAERKCEQKKRWFKQGQKWRTGCEGRISVLKRRHGVRRCLYKGDDGMRRWVGLGVIADNLAHIGTVLAAKK